MKGPKGLFERDYEIDRVVSQIVGIIKRKRLEKDRRDQWFANAQLDTLRKLLERQGYRTARLFQVGKIDKKDNRWEAARNEALVEILDLLGGKSALDVVTCSYILGKLNSIIDEVQKREGQK